jgi:hypothetical protein
MSVSTFVLDNAAIQLSENGITLAVFSGFIDCTKPDGLCGGKTDLHKGSIISDANTLHNQVFDSQGIRFVHFGDDTPCQRELAKQTITESISRVISKRSAK